MNSEIRSLEDRKQMITQGIIWIERQSREDRWGLTESEVCTLLGGISQQQYLSYIASAHLEELSNLPDDVTNRLSLLLNIHKSLYLTAPQGMGYQFFNRPNTGSFLNGLSVKQYLLRDGSLDSMLSICRWLGASAA